MRMMSNGRRAGSAPGRRPRMTVAAAVKRVRARLAMMAWQAAALRFDEDGAGGSAAQGLDARARRCRRRCRGRGRLRTRSPRMLKIASRTRPDVGRSRTPRGSVSGHAAGGAPGDAHPRCCHQRRPRTGVPGVCAGWTFTVISLSKSATPSLSVRKIDRCRAPPGVVHPRRDSGVRLQRCRRSRRQTGARSFGIRLQQAPAVPLEINGISAGQMLPR